MCQLRLNSHGARYSSSLETMREVPHGVGADMLPHQTGPTLRHPEPGLHVRHGPAEVRVLLLKLIQAPGLCSTRMRPYSCRQR